jgi:hypothetical protein
MATTFDPIATTTLGSAAASITFSSIAATYTDLRIVLVGRSDIASANSASTIRFNGDSASNYSCTFLRGDGSSASSTAITSTTSGYLGSLPGSTATAGAFGLVQFDLFSYAGSTYKTFLSASGSDSNGAGRVERWVNLWRSTSAVTSIVLTDGNGGNFTAGTTATLYGILKA